MLRDIARMDKEPIAGLFVHLDKESRTGLLIQIPIWMSPVSVQPSADMVPGLVDSSSEAGSLGIWMKGPTSDSLSRF